MIRAAGVSVATVVALAATAAFAQAVPPEITSVGQEDRHPTVWFTAPRASSVSVYIATTPDRATDGTFLQENVVETGFLTDDEIRSGEWMDSSQIDPGRYFVMLKASSGLGDCVTLDTNTLSSTTDPSCADGSRRLCG